MTITEVSVALLRPGVIFFQNLGGQRAGDAGSARKRQMIESVNNARGGGQRTLHPLDDIGGQPVIDEELPVGEKLDDDLGQEFLVWLPDLDDVPIGIVEPEDATSPMLTPAVEIEQ